VKRNSFLVLLNTGSEPQSYQTFVHPAMIDIFNKHWLHTACSEVQATKPKLCIDRYYYECTAWRKTI